MLQTERNIDYKYLSYREQKKQQKNEAGKGKLVALYVFFLIVLSAILVVYFSQSFHMTHLTYKIDNLNQELANVKNQNHQLKLKLAQKSSLAKIEYIARNKLNMVEPEKMEIVVVNSNPKNKDKMTAKKSNQTYLVFKVLNNFMDKLNTVKAFSPN